MEGPLGDTRATGIANWNRIATAIPPERVREVLAAVGKQGHASVASAVSAIAYNLLEQPDGGAIGAHNTVSQALPLERVRDVLAGQMFCQGGDMYQMGANAAVLAAALMLGITLEQPDGK